MADALNVFKVHEVCSNCVAIVSVYKVYDEVCFNRAAIGTMARKSWPSSHNTQLSILDISSRMIAWASD